MSILNAGFAGGDGSSGTIDTGDIEHSLRFRSSATAYLSRTPGSAGNRKTWTWSGWVKRGALGGSLQMLFAAIDVSASNYTQIAFYNDVIYLYAYPLVGSGVVLQTNAVFRDTASYLHLIVSLDTTNATATERAAIFVNGIRITSFAVDNTASIPLNADAYLNSAVQHNIGNRQPHSNALFDGYLSRVCFVDGQALTPDSFGYLNTEINAWISKTQSACKAVVDNGGTNSFMLDFDDGTSTTTLGYDKSSKSNNWTCNNISLTAGSTYDWMEDVPGNNFAVLNPLENGATNNGVAPSWGNLRDTWTNGASGFGGRRASISPQTNPFYFEVTITSNAGSGTFNGVGSITRFWDAAANQLSFLNHFPGGVGTNILVQLNGVTQQTVAFASNGDILGFAVNPATGSVAFYQNNTLVTTRTDLSNVDAVGLGSGSYSSGTHDINFGQRPFAYTPPTGFQALCTANLPAPAIAKPSNHFDVKLYVGNASTQNITGLDFQPDLVWMKSRGRAVDHAWYDSVRGVQKQLESNSTGIETTEATGLTAFNSDGWTMGALDQINNTTATNAYVGWAWKANGAAVTNTDGSITSQVSANTQAGFSIVTYTGTGANATVGHGLGVAPRMIITKRRTGAAVSWGVYHASIGSSNALYLDLTNASAASTNWNGTPTSTVFGIGTAGESNLVSQNYVAYCFAEVPGFSRIGSYTGNGSADGPFVYCGFRPKFVLIKRTDTTSNWTMLDADRRGYNVDNDPLYPNLSNAEGTTDLVDIVSNGFKLRTTDASVNASGGTYISLAFADTPFKYSNAR